MPEYSYAYCLQNNLLREGDVLLYRGTGIISRSIQKLSRGRYSHASVASKNRGLWEAVQFREFKGGIAVNLKNDVSQSNSVIDVYRPVPYFSRLILDEETGKTDLERVKFDGHAVTDCMRQLTGLPYGYNRIVFLARYYLRFWRDWTELSTDDTVADDIVYPVCSTVLSHCFSKKNFDLLKNRSDDFMSPSDFALSPRLNQLFSIVSLA